MPRHRVFEMKFANVYPMYVAKAERKNRTRQEVDQVICWLTGYDQAGLQQQVEQEHDLETFFAQAPAMHPNRSLSTGVVCGVRVEEVEDPLMQKIRFAPGSHGRQVVCHADARSGLGALVLFPGTA
jgi:hypothetical protein